MLEAIFIGLFGVAVLMAPFYILEFIIVSLGNLWRSWSQRQAERRDEQRQTISTARSRIEQRRRERLQAQQDRIDTLERKREQAQQQRHAVAERQQAASEQRRRNDARAACESRWSRYAPQINKLFSRPDFERFVKTFMSDAHPAEEVEERAAELLSILEGFYIQHQAPPPTKQFTNIEELTTWFVEQQARIAKLPLDAQTLEEHAARLNATYADLAERLLEQPS